MTKKLLSPGQVQLLSRLALAPKGRLPADSIVGIDQHSQMRGLVKRGLALPNEAGDAWLVTPAGLTESGEIPY